MSRCLSLALTLGVGVVLLLTVGLAVASADSGDEVAAKTITTTLQPGDNFVGWVAEPQLAAELFAAFPQIELIYTWDPARGQYRYAHPDVEPYSDPLELLIPQTPVVIRIGDEATSVRQLFDAEPRIQLIYRWNASKGQWHAAWPAFPREKWTLDALAPGMTAVIRIESETTAQDLFESLPQIDLISRYDEAADKNLYAVRGLTQAMGDLSTLTPGMGLVVRLIGEEPVEWERQRRPAQGTVELQPGRNLVAWMGRDQAPLDRVVLGVGHHFERAGLWSRDQQTVLFHEPEAIESAAAQPTVNFGDALWVDVGRSVVWLQPTGILPEVIIAGNVSESLKQEIQEVMRSVLDFYWERFGIEADFSRYQAYFPLGCDAFIEAINSHLPKHLGDLTHYGGGEQGFCDSFSNSGGAFLHVWQGTVFYVRLSKWTDSVRAGLPWGHLATAHEYTHLVQYQLSEAVHRWHPEDEPVWLSEGMATWVENSVLNSRGVSQAKLAADVHRDQVGLPVLSDTVSDGHTEYRVGAAAALSLAPTLSENALFDLYQAFAPASVGPQLRWHAWTTWYEAFEEVFGETVEDFYERFESARRGSRESGHGHSHSPPLVRATVVIDDDNAAWQRYRLMMTDSLGTRVGDWVRVSEQHEFPLSAGESYRLAVEVGDRVQSCLVFWTEEGFVGHYNEAQVLELAPDETRSLELNLSNVCPHAIRGRVLTEDGQPLLGIYVRFVSRSGSGRQGLPWSNSPSTYTDSDGRFEFLVPVSAHGTVHVGLAEECMVPRAISSVSTADQAVGNAGEFQVEIADSECGFRITGMLVDAEGNGIANTYVSGIYNAFDYIWTRTDAYGGFSINVSSGESYQLGPRIDGCQVYFRLGGLVASRDDATRIAIHDRDVTGIRIQLGEGMCEFRISGKLLNADGLPRSGQGVGASGDTGSAAVLTDADGSFSFAVPGNGSYRLSFHVDGCTLYSTVRGVTTDYRSAREVRVSNADVTGIEFRLPENPATFCD